VKKTVQQTTTIDDRTVTLPETVTVVDPRHPLVGRTFRLLELANKPYFGYCCLVAFRGPVERHIPVCVTNLAAEPLVIFPLPLDLASVQQLVATYERIGCQRAEGTEDESQRPVADRNGGESATPRDLAAARRRTAAARVPDVGPALPPPAADDQAAAREA
jgi:hypothetical protein